MDRPALLEKLARISREANELLAGEITAEVRTKLGKLNEDRVATEAEIAALDADVETRATFAQLDNYLNKPEYRTPRGDMGTGGDHRSLPKGWEIRTLGGQNVIHAPTADGKLQPMWAEEVLFGSLEGRDKGQSEFFERTRASMKPEYRAAYVRFIQLASRYRSESMAMTHLTPAEQRALSEGTDTAGGALVPPDMVATMLVRAAQKSVMRRYATVINTTRDKVVLPRVQPHGTSGSIYSSAFVGSWVGETPSASDVDPAFGTFEIGIKKLRVQTRLGNDLVSDAQFNVLAFLAMNGAENMALTEDSAFVAGDGTALQPLGIINGGATTVDIEGSTADTISNTTAAAGSAPKLIDLVYGLPSQYADNASFLFRRSVEGKIRKLVDGQGRFHWPAQAGSSFAATPRELMGYPVGNSEFVPADGTNGNTPVVFGDLSHYYIAQRAQITSVVLRERYADTDQMGFIMFLRVGGALANEDAIRLGTV